MAINIKRQYMPPDKNNKEDKPQMFPRITESEMTGELQLVQWIADHDALSRAILYKLKTGCQWKHLPVKALFTETVLGHEAVFHHFNKWRKARE